MSEPLSFGDEVEIVRSESTESEGVAGSVGQIYGFTTPSSTGVEVVGGAPDDFALNVFFEDSGRDLWFNPNLLVFRHHNPGAELHIDGAPTKSVRNADGSWREVSVGTRGAWSRLRNWLSRS